MEWEYAHMSINHFYQHKIILPKANANGYYLLELLISLVIISFGLLGIAGLLITAHRASSSSYLNQQAQQSVYNIIDRIHANRTAAVNGNYNVSNLVTSGAPTLPKAPSKTCLGSGTSFNCSASEMATYDLWYWLNYDVGSLPNGAASITTSVNGTNTLLTVTVQWDDSPAQKSLGAAGAVSSNNANIAQFSVGTLL